jgi:ADP-L-glycero-D-manno-heptose 6-epimerase
MHEEEPAVSGDLILVTGGAGFIGSHVARDLACLGARIVVADWLSTGEKWRNLAGAALYDIIRPEALFEWLRGEGERVSAVIHLGAISSTAESDVDRIVAANIRLSLNLWAWCAGRGARMIYASSAATYGNGSAGFVDDESAQALARLSPLNAYGWSKHFFDRRVIADVAAGRPVPRQCCGLKFFNVYGQNEAHKGAMQSAVAKMYRALRAGEPLRLFRSHNPLWPDGGQKRDFVFVEDCVAVVRWLLAHPQVSGLFNVGTGTARSFLDVAHAVGAALGRDPEISFIDTPEEYRDAYQYFTEADMTKLRAAGFARPFHMLEEGVRAFVLAEETGRGP